MIEARTNTIHLDTKSNADISNVSNFMSPTIPNTDIPRMFEPALRLIDHDLEAQTAIVQKEHDEIGKDNRYNVYGDTINFYDKSFKGVLNGKSIVDIVDSIKAPVIIDLMAPTNTIFEVFQHTDATGPYKGIAVTLEDKRTYRSKSRDKQWNIQQVTGDLTDPQICIEIGRQLEGKRADLVIERALLGLIHIPIHVDFYKQSLRRVWTLLNPNGGIFLGQTLPESVLQIANIDMSSIVENLSGDGIDAEYAKETSDNPYGAIRITKHPGSPKRLPI